LDPILLDLLTNPTVLVLLNLVSFLIGLLIGNWLAINRDRRKERNDAAKAVRAILFEHRRVPSPYDRNPSAFDYDTLERLLPILKRRAFCKAIDRYDESRKAQKRDAVGQAFYVDDASVRASLEKLIRCTEWR
jgi:hypothetical protein